MLLHILATPGTRRNLITKYLEEYCPGLDYELAVTDLKYEITRSQKPKERVIVQSIGTILDLEKQWLIKNAIICCACVADTLYDVVTNTTTSRVTQVHQVHQVHQVNK